MRALGTFLAASFLSGCVPSSTVLDNCAEGCCGGACINNVCQPVQLIPTTSNGGIEIGGDFVYYCVGSLVQRVPKAGGAAEVFASIGNGNECRSLWADEPHQLLYVGSTALLSIDMQGTASQLIQNEAPPVVQRIVVTNDAVIWTGARNGFQGVFRTELSTHTTRALPFPYENPPTALALGPDGRIYWADGLSYDVWVTRADGTDSVKLHQGRPPPLNENLEPEPSKIAVDRAYAYYAQAGSMYRVAVSGKLRAEVLAPSSIAHGISVDERGLFWSDVGSGQVTALRFVDPGHPETLLSGLRTRNLVADEACLYFQEESSGAIYKLAKPRSP